MGWKTRQYSVAAIRRRWGNLGLWPRMALGISLGFLVLFIAFSVLAERAVRDSTDRVLKERLVIAQMAASQFDRQLQQAVAQLEQAHHFADFDPARSDLSVADHTLTIVRGREGAFSSVTFLDPNGRVVLSQPPSHARTHTDLSSLPYIAAALGRRQVTISEPLQDPLTNRPVTAVTVPIFDNSRFLGLLSGELDLSGPAITTPLTQAATLGQTAHAVLVDTQGRVLASTFQLPLFSPGEHATFYRQASAHEQPTIATVPFELNLPGETRGHLHIMAFAPLHAAPWAVAVGGDEDETLAGVRRLRLGLALLGTVALSGTWAVTLIGTRRLVRPVQRLTLAAQRIAAGDLHTPLQAPEGGEIGAMAAALEHMRALLLANIDELATWNETLEARVVERTEELRQQQILTQQLLHQVISVQEEERARISYELHDEIGQTLTAIQLSMNRLARALPEADNESHERLSRVQTLTEQALTDLRRMIAALRPGVLDQLGLVPALGWMADHTLRPLGLRVAIDADGLQRRLPRPIETILFRIAQEAMSNVARHSGASSLDIHLDREDGQATMTLADDGVGFDPAGVASAPDQGRGLGLAGMRERASLAAGQVSVTSAPGRGTTVCVVIPLPTAAEEPAHAIAQLSVVDDHR